MKYEVHAIRTEVYVAEVEAKSKYEAAQLADVNYCDYDWKEVDGTLDVKIDAIEEIKEQ